MKLSPLAAVVVFAVFAPYAVSAEPIFGGLDDEASFEQGERDLTGCYKKRCKQVSKCKVDDPDKCPEAKLDFDDDCFNDGDKYPFISKLPGAGVSVYAKRNHDTSGKNRARIMHTGELCSSSTGIDTDMRTPNRDFCFHKDLETIESKYWHNYPVVEWKNHQCDASPSTDYKRGVGVGDGGKKLLASGAMNKFANDKYLGNCVMIEEHDSYCSKCADDAAVGGKIFFTFHKPMRVDHITLLDIDDHAVPVVTFYHADGTSSTLTGVVETGNNGVLDLDDFVKENVVKIEFKFPSSGGVCAINYRCQHADGGGDPHFTTWSGEHFDFQGACDLVLVDNPTFKTDVGMHIHGRTKLHGSWSAFSSVAVKMGEDVLEVHGSAAPFINGVELPFAPMDYGSEFLLPMKLAGFDVSIQNTGPNSRKYIIHLGNGERIFINNFKEFVDLDIENVQSSEFMGSSGLLGNFKAGTKLARDGKTLIDDSDVLGQEWQVTDADPLLFTLVDGPQYPAKCIMPEKLSAEQRHLRALNKKVSEDDAKKACSNAKPDRMQNCIADVFGSDNIDMAGIYTVHSF